MFQHSTTVWRRSANRNGKPLLRIARFPAKRISSALPVIRGESHPGTDGPSRSLATLSDTGAVRKLVLSLREPYCTIVLTAVLTGLRPSELFGLHWSDLDFDHETMRISRSYYMGEFSLPKTTKSTRTLLMPAVLIAALKAHQLCSAKKETQLVFSTRDGEPIDPSRVLEKAVYPALAKLQLLRVGWRGFRRTVATLLQDLGVAVKVAQEQLGHANPTTTLAIYTHAVPESRKLAISQLAAQLFPDSAQLCSSF